MEETASSSARRLHTASWACTEHSTDSAHTPQGGKNLRTEACIHQQRVFLEVHCVLLRSSLLLDYVLTSRNNTHPLRLQTMSANCACEEGMGEGGGEVAAHG